jgi:hypothetical protein
LINALVSFVALLCIVDETRLIVYFVQSDMANKCRCSIKLSSKK